MLPAANWEYTLVALAREAFLVKSGLFEPALRAVGDVGEDDVGLELTMPLALVRLDVGDVVLVLAIWLLHRVQFDEGLVVLLTEQADFTRHAVDLTEEHLGLLAIVGEPGGSRGRAVR